jgi:hypothetical protein
MSHGRLTPAQVEILRALAGVLPRWRLCGGGALAGFYTQHRGTRDLHLLWEAPDLAPLGDQIERRLGRFRVTRGDEVVVVDVVAEPMSAVVPPVERSVGGVRILVDAPHEILVAKLTALLGRSELRDLEDVRALLAAGGDLERALADAPRKDGGFSAPTLAWVLEQFPVEALARGLGRDPRDAAALAQFRDDLIAKLLEASKPE